MKIVYLDQNHWIELSRAAHGRVCQPEAPDVLDTLRKARALGRACFPLSLAHYLETLKRHDPGSRARLAKFMLELSGGVTMASLQVVVRHEIELALDHCFPGRIVSKPFAFLGTGLTHAVGRAFGFRLEWPPEANEIPPSQRMAFEREILATAERSLLSGVQTTEDSFEFGPAMDLTFEHRFKAALEDWRGVASEYPPAEFERRTYAITLSDISKVLWETLSSNNIPIEEFALLGESRWRTFLDNMPSRRADMHLRRQWAKNASLLPRVTDLNDWAYLGVAGSYCDVVVTENQVTDLFSRGFNMPAAVVFHLTELPELLV